MKALLARLLRRVGIPPEKTFHAAGAWLIEFSIKLFPQGLVRSRLPGRQVLLLARIDAVNEIAPKFILDLASLSCRVDITGLREVGVKIASDTRSFNRGNLIINGGWTSDFNHKYVDPFEEASLSDYRFDTHETVRLMFTKDVPWRHTPEYRLFESQLREGFEPYGIKNNRELENRGEVLRRLYRSMESDGYKMSQEVGGHYWDEAHFYLNQVGQICVGRHGNHRLAIARMLGVGAFPAIFGGVHVSYVDSLSAEAGVARKLVYEALEKHPAVIGRVT